MVKILADKPAARRWLLAVGVLVLVSVAFAAGWAVRPGASTPHDAVVQAHDEPEADHDHDSGGETTYYCSMHPDQRSTDPDATCPICGMAMVPMPGEGTGAEDDGELPVLRLSERSARLLDIQTAPAERRQVQAPVRFVGQLEADPRRTREVVARSDSYVETLHANYTWMRVDEGEPLAELYSPQVNAAAHELLVAHRRGGDAAIDAARARMNRLGVSDEHVQRIIDSGDVPRTHPIRSPIAGVLRELDGYEGRWLAEGERLATLADLSTLWLELEAYETDLQWLRTGQDAAFTVEAHPGESFVGTVAFIDPVLDERTRTARVRLDVPNPGGRLKPGMFARGTVQALAQVAADAEGEGEPPLLIPRTAPLITGERAVVYVRRPNVDRPVFEGRQITLGPRVGEHYIVRDGLEAGERVVTHGQFKLDSELQIRGRPSMMGRDAPFDPHRHHDQADDHADHVDAPHADAVPTDYPLTVCVVSGEPLGAMGEPVVHEHEGQTVVFCCPACVPTFEDEPQRHLAKIDEARQ